jgi:hypothetical protein
VIALRETGGSRRGGLRFESAPQTVSIVVCTYAEGRWVDLLAVVDSLCRQTLPPLETVVVVDHNQPLFERVCETLPGVVAVANAEQRGLSGARNTGVAAARGDVVVFIDDDAVAAPDWLERLMAAYANSCVLGVGGAVEPAWHAGRPSTFPPEFDWVVGCTFRGMPEERAPVRNLIGANMSFRRDVLIGAGRFRSGIGRVGMRPLGCEETELCIRASRLWPEGVFLFEPAARVSHQVPPSRVGCRYFGSRCYAEGWSKAIVTRLVGSGKGLATERAYVARTLPQAVLRGLGDGLLHGDPAGLGRAAAVLVGLGCTIAGYVAGLVAANLKTVGET